MLFAHGSKLLLKEMGRTTFVDPEQQEQKKQHETQVMPVPRKFPNRISASLTGIYRASVYNASSPMIPNCATRSHFCGLLEAAQ
jgi:hypothetical protein